MKWSDVGRFIGKAAPIAGKVLTGNIPGAVAEVASWISAGLGVEASPDAVMKALQGNPDAVVKVQQIMADKAVRLQELANQLEIAQGQQDVDILQAINETIRADITGQSWLQRNTHSLMKFWFAGLLTMIYFILPMTGKPVPSIPETVWLAFGAVLGVKSWYDGKRREAAVKGARM